jgi:eukaryotic-like serine/threonine-protein kinase
MPEEKIASSAKVRPEHDGSEATMEHGAAADRTGAAAAPARSVPLTIGRYRIVRLIAEGGMGAVYEAEQEKPHRLVALKLIKSGFATADLRRRFEQEAHVLGRLQHPGIAQIYEAGSVETDFGPQPYFAMELIAGRPLLRAAAERQLDTRARLELVATVCDAVQHAHQRGIVHRDLKPANILVDGAGQAKILDFGVARVSDADAQATRQTTVGQIVGTLAYMSPEQVTGDPFEVDTRVDVYALGVTLYELLAGRLPFDVYDKKFSQAVQVIQEQEAAPLSSVSRAFRGDIETIVAKALEKDKTRRYASASDLAADIRRYLHDEPILAQPASTAYQLRKFARRNRALVAGTAAVFVVLVGGIAASSWEAVRARRAEHQARQAEAQSRSERDRAVRAEALATSERDHAITAEQTATSERDRAVRAETQARQERDRAVAETHRADSEAATATAINDFLQTDLLAQASAVGQRSGAKPDPDIKVRTVLDRAATEVAGKFSARPKVEASIEKTIGLTYDRLGLLPEAESHLRKALTVARNALGSQNAETLAIARQLGETLRSAGKYPDSEALLRETLDGYARTPGASERASLQASASLGSVYLAEGKYALAEPILNDTLARAKRLLGPDHDTTIEAMGGLARVNFIRGNSAAAEALLLAIIDSRTRVLGPDHPLTLGIMNNLAVLYQRDKRFSDAEKIYVKVLEGEKRARGADHPETLNVMNNLGVLYSIEGKYKPAEDLYAQVLTGWTRSLGPEHPRVLSLLSNIGVLKQSEGKNAEAEAQYRAVLEARRRVLGSEHTDTVESTRLLGALYEIEGKYAEAEPLLAQALEVRRRVLGPKHVDTLASAMELGELRLDQRRYSEAESLLRDSLETQKQVVPNDFRRYQTESLLGAALAAENKYAEAEPLLVSGYEGMKQRQMAGSALYRPKLRKACEQLIEMYEHWSKPDQAAALRKELAEISQN